MPMPAQYTKGPPVVSVIQALDQYGNIIAESRNPNAPLIATNPAQKTV